MDKKRKLLTVSTVIILFIIVIGLRVLFMNTAFWYDEACSWFSAKQSFPLGIMDNLLHLDLQHTPLYFMLLHFWMIIFGDSEIAIRVLSLIFGIATVPVVYFAAKKIIPSYAAIAACFIAAVSPVLVFFSVEARMYPIVIFMVMLSINYLIDFEQKKDISSLMKLVITNILIPYTLVGGILYNISLASCYGLYLFKNKRDLCITYLKGLFLEIIFLIPYFLMIGYYAKMRSVFVIKHEGPLAFFQIVDLIRNFFGVLLTPNPYWPAVDPYVLDTIFALLVIVPCVYFVYGLVQGFKCSEKFLKCLYLVLFVNFVLALIFSAAEVFVFTVRYILYLLPPMIILAVSGLYTKLSKVHVTIFVVLFCIAAVGYNIQSAEALTYLKSESFKVVRTEADSLQLNKDDMIIMPLGADAPYYFRDDYAPRVLNFDFHKEIRNPYNNKYYDPEQQKLMDKPAKYGVIYDAVFADKIFSKNYHEYFVKEVNDTVPSGRFVLLALYGADASSVVPMQDTRRSITSIQDVKNRTLSIMLEKYLYDMGYILGEDFVPVTNYTKGNYTYFLFKKK